MLHPQVISRLDEIEKIEVETQEAGVRIIDKTGPLDNPADRDHCLQYMIAIALLHGNLTADHYEDEAPADPRSDALREKMAVREHERFSREYLDPEKRSIGNALTVHFKDGSRTERVAVSYPIGHRRRRKEGIPLLMEKFETHLGAHFPEEKAEAILQLFSEPKRLDQLPVDAFMEYFVFQE